jgi:hypothetical protein
MKVGGLLCVGTLIENFLLDADGGCYASVRAR